MFEQTSPLGQEEGEAVAADWEEAAEGQEDAVKEGWAGRAA